MLHGTLIAPDIKYRKTQRIILKSKPWTYSANSRANAGHSFGANFYITKVWVNEIGSEMFFNKYTFNISILFKTLDLVNTHKWTQNPLPKIYHNKEQN